MLLIFCPDHGQDPEQYSNFMPQMCKKKRKKKKKEVKQIYIHIYDEQVESKLSLYLSLSCHKATTVMARPGQQDKRTIQPGLLDGDPEKKPIEKP